MQVKNSLTVDGKGLFSTRKYIKDEIIYKLTGSIFDNPTRETIYIGNGQHILDEYGQFINHSFNPNIYIDNNNIVALRDINEDEELVFNYNDNEINMANPFYVDNILVNGIIQS